MRRRHDRLGLLLLFVGAAACGDAREPTPGADTDVASDTQSAPAAALEPDTAPATGDDTASASPPRDRPVPEAEAGSPEPDRPPAPPEPEAPVSDLPGYDTVFVYYQTPAPAGEVTGPQVPLPRAVPADTDALSFALEELLAGPSAAEEAQGTYFTWFSDETAGMVRWVTLEDGMAVVELGDLRSIIPNASSSAGSAMLMQQLEATVFQFPDVRRVEFRIDGSCDAFMAWLQIGCVPIRRGGFTPPGGYRMAVPADPDG